MKAAYKLHLGLDHDGLIPAFAHITHSKQSDLSGAQLMKFPKGSVLVFDRGYQNYSWHNSLTEKGISQSGPTPALCSASSSKPGARTSVNHFEKVSSICDDVSSSTFQHCFSKLDKKITNEQPWKPPHIQYKFTKNPDLKPPL